MTNLDEILKNMNYAMAYFLFNISNRIIQKKSTLRNYIFNINSFNPKTKNNEENYFHGVFRIS